MLLIDEPTKTIFLHNPGCGGEFVKESYAKARPDFPKAMLYGLPDPGCNIDEKHINAYALPRFVPDYKKYKLITFVRNPYDRFMAASKIAAKLDLRISQLWSKNGNDPKAVCSELLNCDFATQDDLLRNPLRPWLMPQSLFTARGAHLLRYESKSDWQYLFNALGIGQAPTTTVDSPEPDDSTKAMIRELYFDDEELFEMYK